ncbi:tRNA pseudouridine(55) synthase TruB [Actinomyces succiniciruminis]|uniref:tRNA pseudouridine synthase B n=1 Tax=Actinomyces succiniciruminis TaxID=1522002 RepID=A0A1L7RPD2_9ACTO|nr:tRNA pseudouridine(55) synthase TruB [Actinomyces succiniciruminis]CED91184.1 tRNA pseudouridine synthase B [Actinomyces succiniciruminis]
MSNPAGRPTGRRIDVPRGSVTSPDGLLVVDKPAGVTSHDVVAMTRRLAATRKVGHAGTLDPAATGVLLLGIGRATRFLTYLVGADKTYRATARLGQTTLTEDADGEFTSAAGCPPGPDLTARIDTALASLTGEIMQVPSAVSAIKIDGVRSYARVRGGEDVDLPARPVTIHALTRSGAPRSTTAADGTAVVDVDLEVHCSSGTYVRALARDLGTALGCGAHLTALRRTEVGPFSVAEAATIASLSAVVAAGQTLPVLPLAAVARRCFPAVALDEVEARALRHGQPLPAAVLDRAQPPGHRVISKAAAPGVAAGFDPAGGLVALLAHKGEHARPVLVLSN